MNKFITILFILISGSLYAQMTLTSAYIPSVGDFHAIASCDTNGINQGPSGANVTWNFSSLNITGDTNVIQYVSPSSTPYGVNYPGSTISFNQGGGLYNYFQQTGGDLNYMGSRSSNSNEVLTNLMRFATYPFSYTNSYTDDFAGTFTASGFTSNRTGVYTLIADAWGTLILPSGTYPNTLRLKAVVDSKDSAFVGVPIVSKTLVTSYIWFIPSRKYPVMEIVYTSITILGNTTTSKLVDFSPFSTVGVNQISTTVPEEYAMYQNYPNPFNPYTKIRFAIPKAGEVKLSVYNSLGEEIGVLVNDMLSAGSYEAVFDASQYSSGVYYYTIESVEFKESRKMIVVK